MWGKKLILSPLRFFNARKWFLEVKPFPNPDIAAGLTYWIYIFKEEAGVRHSIHKANLLFQVKSENFL